MSRLGGPGSVTERIKSICLTHMQEWLRLCDEVVMTEFPDFHMIHAFHVFALAKAGAGGAEEADPTEVKQCLARLAYCFNVPSFELAQQFDRLRPIAVAHHNRTGSTHRDSWQYAWLHRGRNVDASALQRALQAYLGWGVSTSGVERSFAVARRLLLHRERASDAVMFNTMKLAQPMPTAEQEVQRTIGLARELWAAQYGTARHGTSHKPGLKRKKPENTMEGFMRQRRVSVGEAAASNPSQVVHPMAHTSTELSDTMKEEIEHQRQKRQKRMAEAVAFGHVSLDECPAGFAATAEQEQRTQDKNDMAAARRKARVAQVVSPQGLSTESIASMKMFVSADAQEHVARVFPGVGTVDLLDAEVLIVKSLIMSDLGSKLQLAALLTGAYIITPAFFKGSRACVKHSPALQVWRRLHITGPFEERHVGIVQLLKAASEKRGKFKVLGKDAFLAAHAKAGARSKKLFFVLKASTEGHGPIAGIPGVKALFFQQFQELITRVDQFHTVGTVDTLPPQ